MTEFKCRPIHPNVVLYNFKKLQNYFSRTGEKVLLQCNPNTEEIILETAFLGYKGDNQDRSYRVNMFARSSTFGVDPDILQYIHDNYLLEKINNENLILWYGMAASRLCQHITLEDFLKALKDYKLNGFKGINRPSILDEYLAEEEEEKEVTETKELVAA